MKRKDRLANEYQRKTWDDYSEEGPRSAFVAGFEKARELALRESRKLSQNSLFDRLKCLGEEECE